jgi:DNA-nicking Smr family endonuclease
VTTLKDFESLGKAMRQRQREAAAEQARRLEQARLERQARLAQEREQQTFVLAVGPVQRLADRGLAEARGPKPPPWPVQRLRDERQALQEALSDDIDVESLLLTDDGLSFRRAGVGLDVVTRLRRGHWAVRGEIDLHGLRRDEARSAVAEFVRQAHRQGKRCLRIVHGKGHGSPGREPVLKGKVQRWLAQCDEVIAFTQASAPQGGAGALIVLLAG